jgi:hypothetical protein
VLHRIGDCPDHLARFIIITELPEPCIFFVIFIVFPIELIVGTCKNA